MIYKNKGKYIGRKFKLIGRDNIFETVRQSTDWFDCVHGITLDGKSQTMARVADVEFIN